MFMCSSMQLDQRLKFERSAGQTLSVDRTEPF